MDQEITPEQQQFEANLANQLNGRWGKLLGQTFITIEQLEFQNRQQAAQIQNLTENEAALVSHIQDIEAELAELKPPPPPPSTMSPEAAEIAARASAVIRGEKTE